VQLPSFSQVPIALQISAPEPSFVVIVSLVVPAVLVSEDRGCSAGTFPNVLWIVMVETTLADELQTAAAEGDTVTSPMLLRLGRSTKAAATADPTALYAIGAVA